MTLDADTDEDTQAPDLSTLSGRLKAAFAWRRRVDGPRSVNQTALAEACGITQGSVSHWFTGDSRTMSGDCLVAAARYLDVPPEWLATGRGDMAGGFIGSEPPSVREALVVLQEALAKLPPSRRESIGVLMSRLVHEPDTHWIEAVHALLEAPGMRMPSD